MAIIRQVSPALIVRLSEGDEVAFKQIYELLHKQVYAFIFSLLKNQEQSEDLLQEAFLALWINKEKLQMDKPLVTYMYVMVRRLAIDSFRKKLSESNFKDTLTFKLTEVTTNTEDKIRLNDLQCYTNEVINSLPPRQKAVFKLSRQEDLSYDEIADQLKLSRNTVRNHLVCALKTLRVALTKNVLLSLTVLCAAILD